MSLPSSIAASFNARIRVLDLFDRDTFVEADGGVTGAVFDHPPRRPEVAQGVQVSWMNARVLGMGHAKRHRGQSRGDNEAP